METPLTNTPEPACSSAASRHRRGAAHGLRAGGAQPSGLPHPLLRQAFATARGADLRGEPFRRVQRYLGIYAVLVEDRAIVTVGHRVTRLPR